MRKGVRQGLRLTGERAHFLYEKFTYGLLFLDVGVSSEDSQSVILLVFFLIYYSIVVVRFWLDFFGLSNRLLLRL
jgi:hypothetical protein